jgi:hypothetical protein
MPEWLEPMAATFDPPRKTTTAKLSRSDLLGLAFCASGIDGAIFWGTVMTVLLIIPDAGAASVWVPATIILIITGEVWRGIVAARSSAVLIMY